jgi:hypothetical protein
MLHHARMHSDNAARRAQSKSAQLAGGMQGDSDILGAAGMAHSIATS